MPKDIPVERMVWPSECAKLLGTNLTTLSAAKNHMGIHRKKVFPSEMEAFFKQNPNFNPKAVYQTKKRGPVAA